MSARHRGLLHDRWAELRFAIVGPLLASPPGRGELAARSSVAWKHPATGEPVRFGAPTIERWYYQARNAGVDRVAALRKKIRKDSGTHPTHKNKFIKQFNSLHNTRYATVAQGSPATTRAPQVRAGRALGRSSRRDV